MPRIGTFLLLVAHVFGDDKAIYGDDSRKDWYQVTDLFANITSQAIVGIGGPFSSQGGRFDQMIVPTTYTLGEAYDLCVDQRFFNDTALVSCSGTLIGPDRVLTAGHCLTGAQCSTKQFIFNYYAVGRDANGAPIFPAITANDVFTCRAAYTQNFGFGTDFAVVQLDRSVPTWRSPVSMLTNRQLLMSAQQLTMVGFPSGIPAKVDEGAQVISTGSLSSHYFVASTDSFGGNSGSGVFDRNGTLVGILSSGQSDYVERANASCYEVKVYNTSTCGCGEIVNYAYVASDVIDCQTDADCVANSFYQSSHCSRPCGQGSTNCTGQCIPETQMGEIKCGDTVSGNTYTSPSVIANDGGDHVYNLNLTQTTRLIVDACASKFDAALTIFSKTDQVTSIADCDDHCGCSAANRPKLDIILPLGEYVIVVDSYAAAFAGVYNITVLCTDASASATHSMTESASSSSAPSASPTATTSTVLASAATAPSVMYVPLFISFFVWLVL